MKVLRVLRMWQYFGDEVKGTAFPVLFRVVYLLENLKVQCTEV
jgi:hypothetical protein